MSQHHQEHSVPRATPNRPLLRRAVGLLQSNGRPSNAELNPIPEDQTASPTKLRRGGVGKSIRRVVQEVFQDANVFRRRSLGTKKAAPANDTAANLTRGHVRSVSTSAIVPVRPPSITTPVDNRHPPSINTVQSAPQLQTSQSYADTTSPISIDVTVPKSLQDGISLTRVTRKKRKRVTFYLDPERGQIAWDTKIIPIECIKEIRSGSDSRYYRHQFQLADTYEDRWITIVYILDGNYKTLHVVADTKHDFEMWETALRKLHTIRQEVMSGLAPLEIKQAIWEKQYWKVADEQADQKLEFEEAERLCKRLNVNTPTDELRRLFDQADKQRRGYLDFSEFRHFVKLLKARPDVLQLYNSLRKENDNRFDVSVFVKFMREEQKSNLTDEELEQIFERFIQIPEPSSPPSHILELPLSTSPSRFSSSPLSPPLLSTRPSSAGTSMVDSACMSLDKFTSFLLSGENAAFSDQRGEVCQDMTRPLSEYYISSSHNTYLVGHQLVGDSTIEGYIRALLHSCRSVEVDIHDGDEEPMITHGKTLTSKVSLREVCEAIAKYGFVTSPYPIIISAEIHCNVAQQDMIVEIMRNVFGETLVTVPSLEERPVIEKLPSPEDLKHRILLKAKNLFLLSELDGEVVDESTDTSASSASDFDIPLEPNSHRRLSSNPDNALGLRRLSKPRSHKKTVSASAAPTNAPTTPQPMLSPSGLVRSISKRSQNSDRPKPKMSFALVALLVYTVGVKCRGINKKETYAPEHMFSLSEKTANKFLKQGMIDLIKHNRTHLVRIYPKGTRLSSTNYGPHRYWSAGAQLVAINWQTFDLGYMINHAMFQRNGRAGYVLKPTALRVADKSLLQQRIHQEFHVKIISAQQLPRPKDASGREIIHKSVVDPYVEVSLHVPDWTTTPMLAPSGASSPNYNAPTAAHVVTYRTGAVKNNGFNPMWHERICIPFDCVGDMLDLVFVKFAVRWEDKDNAEPLALYCASLGSLQRGYRHLPLHDAQLSQYLFSTLFVHIDIQTIT